MYEQFPDVIELNVGGVHYTTHLSTLKKEEGSTLADLFSGRETVYKDKNGRYFLDGDGKLFQHILDYLRADIMPFKSWQQTTAFGFGSSYDYHLNSFDKMVIALYKEAVLFGLKGLVSYLEQCKSVYIERQLEKFRNSKSGYKECLKEVLDAIPVSSMLGSTKAYVVFVQDGAVQQARCCGHSCLFYPTNSFSFGQPRNSSADFVSVKVPFEVDHTILNCLYLDLTNQGFNVACGMSECRFSCEKEPGRLFGSSVFGGKPQRFCCREPIYYMEINFHLAQTQSLFGNPGFSFGGGTGFGSKASSGLFGAQQSSPGQGGSFSFGSQTNSNQGGAFGQGGFGSQQSSFGGGGSAFGGFGSQQNNQASNGQSAFGGFGSQQNNQAGNGQSAFGGFGLQQNNQAGNGQSAFGGFGSQQNNQAGSGFGQSPSGGGLFGSGAKTSQGQSSFTFAGSASSNQSSPSLFGQQNPVRSGTLFGSTDAASQSSQSSTGFSFGSAAGSQKSDTKPTFGTSMSTKQFTTGTSGFKFGGPPVFGQVSTEAKKVDNQDGKSFEFKGFELPKADEEDSQDL